MYFLFHALYLAVKSSSVVSESQDKESIGLISQLTSYLLLYMQEIIRSGMNVKLFFQNYSVVFV